MRTWVSRIQLDEKMSKILLIKPYLVSVSSKGTTGLIEGELLRFKNIIV